MNEGLAGSPEKRHNLGTQMATTLYAYTEVTPTDGYVGYVNLSREDDGSVTLTVRSPGHGGNQTARLTLPDNVQMKLRDALHFEALGFPGAGG